LKNFSYKTRRNILKIAIAKHNILMAKEIANAIKKNSVAEYKASLAVIFPEGTDLFG
jgi:hypothetical protein